MEMARPALALDENNPGSDVAAETAAALAAAAILFSDEADGCPIFSLNFYDFFPTTISLDTF